MDLIKAAEAPQMKDGRDGIKIGDTVKVHFRIVEGKTERIQLYEGIVLAQNNSGINKSITVRKISYGVGVEKIFPVHSPRIDKIEVVRHGKIRRSKLYYLRDRVGKAAKVREKIRRRSDKVAAK